jgi:hypothetical protein
MEQNKKEEYVYFFKHNQVKGVKIGMSRTLKGVMNRFNSFKTYSPFGAKILGFIKTENAIKLEGKLHKRFSSLRLQGEFFNLENDVVEGLIDSYSLEEKVLNDIKLADEYTLKKILNIIHINSVAKYKGSDYKINKVFELDEDRSLGLTISDIKEMLNINESKINISKALKRAGYSSKIVRRNTVTVRGWNVKPIKH